MVTTLIFPKNQWQRASFSINVTILTLSIKRATTVPNKLTDSQHYKRLRRKTLIAFHSLSHFTLTTTQLNLSFLKTLNYSKRFRDWYYLFATTSDFIHAWQRLTELFGRRIIPFPDSHHAKLLWKIAYIEEMISAFVRRTQLNAWAWVFKCHPNIITFKVTSAK